MHTPIHLNKLARVRLEGFGFLGIYMSMKKMGGGLGGVCIFFTGLGHLEFIPQVYAHLNPIRAYTDPIE